MPTTPYIHSKGVLYKFLKTSGGSADMNINGSITPVRFTYKCPDNRLAILRRCNISIFDSGPSGPEFGGRPALPNGLHFCTEDAAGKEIINFTEGGNIKANREFAFLAGPDWALAVGTGVDAVTVRWTFEKAGKQIMLTPGEQFVCIVNDDLTSITAMGIQIQGYFLNENGTEIA